VVLSGPLYGVRARRKGRKGKVRRGARRKGKQG